MWLLPKLTSGDQIWQLPLSEHSAAQLVLALLDENTRDVEARMGRVLQRDPLLTLWVLCRAPHWIQSPPANWSDLASWLQNHIVEEFEGLVPATVPQRERWATFAVRSFENSPGFSTPQRAGSSHETFRHSFLAQAARWFSSSGPEIPTEPRTDNFSNIPRWIWSADDRSEPDHHQNTDRGNDEISAEVRKGLQPDQAVVELSGTLPFVVAKMKRLADLETRFTLALEREKLESLRQLAYGASHEINNPLANIATRGQTLLREESDPERRRKLATIVSQAFRAHEMISDLMLFARPPAPNATTWDLSSLLHEVKAELSPDAQQQQTEIDMRCRDLLTLTADRTQIGVVLKALVRNSLEAIGEGGSIEVSALMAEPDTNDAFIIVSVRDTGPGIAEATRRHLFDPFFSGREAGRGLGFGLSKSWRIVTDHGGTITVDSSPGQGACFSIRLPVSREGHVARRTDAAHHSGAPHDSTLVAPCAS